MMTGIHATPEGVTIGLAETDAAIARCYFVMVQLRPHLAETDFVAQVQEQRREGYHLAFAERAGAVLALGGYRFHSTLIFGRQCYVDDLVTDSSVRAEGVGTLLFEWLVQNARASGCHHFCLDSGVQRFPAHRFYLHHRMHISAHHFSRSLIS